MRTLLRRFLYVLTRRREEDDLAAEIEFHRQMKAEELRERGVGEAEVRAATQKALGNDLLARERARDVWVAPWLQDITQDLRFGLRMLAKDRRFTMAAVIALALGIAVNASVLTILNTAFWRELPFDDVDRLVEIRMIAPRGPGGGLSYPDYRDWSASARTLQGLAAHTSGTMNVSEAGHAPVRLRGSWLHNTFALLRVEPVLGRAFVADDDQPGAPAVAVLAYDTWQGRYGGDTAVIGRAIRVNDVPATIVGVMPPGFAFPSIAQLWMPLSQFPGVFTATRAQRTMSVIGRLADGADLPQAQAEFASLATSTAQAFPETNADFRVAVSPIKAIATGGAPALILATLMGAVGFVLLIACANVTNLLLARSTQRAREMAIRASLGATRWRIVRQTLVECTVIALMAGAIGFVLSRYGAAALSVGFNVMEIGSPDTTVRPYWVDLSIDGTTWMAAGFLCLLASLGIGVLPSWYLSKANAGDIIKDGGRAGGSSGARRWAGGLMVVELALTMMLLTATGLLVRGYFASYSRDLVIDPTNLVTMRMELSAQRYATPDARRRFVADLDARLSGVPLFATVALASDIPLQPVTPGGRLLMIDGRPWPANEKPPQVAFVNVGPRYFDTVGLPIRRGRELRDGDAHPGTEGAIVNERFAARYFPDGDVIGSRIQLSGATLPAAQSPWLTIVGVVPSLPVFLQDRNEEPVVYLPFGAERGPQRGVSVIVRAAGPEGSVSKAAAADALREQVAAVDAELPVFGIQTMDEIVRRSRYSIEVIGSWFLALAVIALTLASVGLYAITAHGVAQRTHEIGVRMALGATAKQVIWLFLRRATVHVALGLALGVTGSLALSQLVQSQFGELRCEPLILGSVAMLLVIVALGASLAPARKAAGVDPGVALRTD